MKSLPPPCVYDPFAYVYNVHWGPTSLNWLRIVGLLVIPRVDATARVLDLCCGTGQLAGELSERGYRVVGLDGSRQMLHYARKNAPGVHLLQADARCFGLRSAFDVVLCTFDSLNHILSVDELEDVFRCVRASMRPGGLFLFDLNTETGYRMHWSGRREVTTEDHTLVSRASFDRKRQLGVFRATVVHSAGSNAEWVEEVVLYQRYHSMEQVLAGLARAGFNDVETYGLEGDAVVPGCLDHAERAFFLCTVPDTSI
ncbi:MAG: class I SAM-dependent methyltransferase [Dehalococcoidia bacterium]|nr:class I SAM-dependent methyltransferase [Dehalococcoidia bacterium]